MPLSGVDVVFCFGNYFWYSPVYKPLAIHFILQAILLVVVSNTPPVDKTFLVYFLIVLLVFLWVAVSGIPPCTNFFLSILVSSNFD